MSGLPNAQLTHVGMFVNNLKTMTDFYCHTLGMFVNDAGHFTGRDLAFLSRSADEHHQIVMIHDPAREQAQSALNQISFRVDDLEALRTFYSFLKGEKAKGLEGRDHGNSWSLYFFDPENNKIEMYVPTPWHVSQPWRAPLDLLKPADQIYAETEALVRQNPTMRPMEEWTREMTEKLRKNLKTKEGATA